MQWLAFSLLEAFSSVDDFIKKAQAVRSDRKDNIAASISPHLNEHGTVGIPPSLAKSIDELFFTHGDETYRQIALFALGKWFETHTGLVEEMFANDQLMEGCSCLMDATRISDSLHLVSELGSFGGDDSWKQMLQETISEAILEKFESNEW